MRSFILIFAFYLLYRPSKCDYQQLFEIVEREHPRKANLLTDFRHLQYLNPVKVITRKPNSRRYGSGGSYTLFPPVESRRVGVPDSPYFPLEKNMEARSRVKKVMADAAPRYKRSPEDEPAAADSSTAGTTASEIETKAKETPKQTPTKKVTTKAANPKPVPAKAIKPKSAGKPNAAVKAVKAKAGQPIVQRSKRKSKPKARKGHKTTSKKAKKSRGARRGQKPKANHPARIKHNVPRNESMFMGSGRRIIAGRDADIKQFPYVISIQKDGQHWCAGALLNQRMFISTANCFWKGERTTRMQIRAGSSYTCRGGLEARISEIRKHPKWSIRSSPDNDVALGLMDRPFRFSDELHAVDLPNHAMFPPFNDVWVTSWGAIREDGLYEPAVDQVLQVYKTNVISNSICNALTSRFGVRVTPNFFCLDQTGQTAPCTADTGAPAVSDGVLWGLASWGIRKRCGIERYPAIFSYIASPTNLFFITEAMKDLMSEERFAPYLDRIRGPDLNDFDRVGSRALANASNTDAEVPEGEIPVKKPDIISIAAP